MQIEWSDQALNDLSEILRYITDEFGLITARRVHAKICNDVNLLEEYPLMGIVIYDNPNENRKYYSLTSKYQKIVYTINGDRLRILTLWNTRRYSKALKRLLSDNE